MPAAACKEAVQLLKSTVANERATAFEGLAEGTPGDAVQHSRRKKKEESASKAGQRDWIHQLVDVHAACGEQGRPINKLVNQNDFGPAVLRTDVRRDLDK